MKLEDFSADLHFSSALYRANYTEFLHTVKPIADEYITKALTSTKQDSIYPATMTETFHFDDRITLFRDSILQVAWSILDSQGYNMDPFFTTMTAMWAQSHPKTSSMDYHVHGEGNQLNAFYILEAPEDSCTLHIYDPRSAKNILSLPVKPISELTLAHNTVNYTPKMGDLIFTNSWLPHSFSRNRSNKNFNFLHININVIYNPDYQPPSCEAPVIV